MTLSRTPPVDWRAQFRQLEKYLDGMGGIVEVRYHGIQCAPEAFVNVLTDCFESRPHSLPKQEGAAILLDQCDYEVKYLSGIKRVFEQKMKLRLPERNHSGISFASEVLTNNSAGGNQYIDVEFNTGPSDVEKEEYQQNWMEALCVILEAFLKEKRLMIVLKQGPSEEQVAFWRDFWPHARCLVQQGLLFVKMVDLSSLNAENLIDKTQHHSVITLPIEFDDTQTKHAIDDVAKIIEQEVPQFDAASSRLIAMGYVEGKRSNVRDLRDGLVALISKLENRDD